MGTTRDVSVLLETNVDNQPCVYLLYKPEINQYKDPNLYLWIRRCEPYTTFEAAIRWITSKLGLTVDKYYQHELFPELTVIEDTRGHKWYIEKAAIHE